MTNKSDALLPCAKEVMQQIALAEAEEAEKQARMLAEAQAEKRRSSPIDAMPSGPSYHISSGMAAGALSSPHRPKTRDEIWGPSNK
jgi:hypothetical protein